MERVPQRIVTLLPAATEMVALIEKFAMHTMRNSIYSHTNNHSNMSRENHHQKHTRLVGRSHECDYPADIVRSLPIVTRPNIQGSPTDSQAIDEAVKIQMAQQQGAALYVIEEDSMHALQPVELIITQDVCKVCAVQLDDVRRIARTMKPTPKILSLNPNTMEQVLDDVIRVGEAMNEEHAAKIAVASMRRRLDRCKLITKHSKLTGSVAMLEWCAPIYPGGHWTAQMLSESKFTYTLNKPGVPSVAITNQRVVECQPTHIIIAPCGFDIDKTKLEAEKHLFCQSWFIQLAQVAQIVIVDGNQMFNRPGPRLVDCVEFITGWLHDRPDLIPPEFPWVNVTLDAKGKASYSVPKISHINCSSISSAMCDESSYEPLNVDTETPSKSRSQLPSEIEELHRTACASKKTSYKDPSTGYTVFTEYGHLKRGTCCGSACRHCPFGHFGVKNRQRQVHLNETRLLLPKFGKRFPRTSATTVHVLFWSGGKDSYLALVELFRSFAEAGNNDIDVVLLTTYNPVTGILPLQMVKLSNVMDQAQHLQLPLLAVPIAGTWSEVNFQSAIQHAISLLHTDGQASSLDINLVFGDLHLEDMVAWRKRVLGPLVGGADRLKFPLLYVPYATLLSLLNKLNLSAKEDTDGTVGTANDVNPVAERPLSNCLIRRLGYRSIILAGIGRMDSKGLLKSGMTYNEALISELDAGIDAFGENGEFHTEVRFS